MKIKICGITRPAEADYLNENRVDYAGFVFYEKSKRNVTIEQAKEIFARLNPDIKKVAVMVSPDATLVKAVTEAGFDILQIHKVLSTEVLETATLPVWYAVNISDIDEAVKKQEFLDELPDNLNSKIKAIVVDAPQFGSGQTFNWRKSRRMLKAGAQSPPEANEPSIDSLFEGREFILAGGLKPENVSEGISIFEPDVVDVSSGVEGSDGKDERLITAFVNAVRGQYS